MLKKYKMCQAIKGGHSGNAFY